MQKPQSEDDLVVLRAEGLYCPHGGFYIDPWRPVERAIITHAHADHARPGSAHYLSAKSALNVLRSRLGTISIQGLAYGEPVGLGAVKVSLHPAGHVLGSAQIRIEHEGRVWVASGDYKTAGVDDASGDCDPTCAPFEPVRCDVFITESTFGLPVYRWASQQSIFDEINQWWGQNATAGRASVLFAYAFGKSQRILAGVDPSIGPIFCHGAVEKLNAAYRASGVSLPATQTVSPVHGPRQNLRAGRTAANGASSFAGCLVLAPPSAANSTWLKRFGEYGDGFASGWMQLRGARRRRALDRGFVLSDHADWPGLLWAIAASGAQRVIVTHGQSAPLVRWLREKGLAAQSFQTEFADDGDDEERPDPDLQGAPSVQGPLND